VVHEKLALKAQGGEASAAAKLPNGQELGSNILRLAHPSSLPGGAVIYAVTEQ